MAKSVLLSWHDNPKGTMSSIIIKKQEEGGMEFKIDENIDSRMEYSYETVGPNGGARKGKCC